MRIVKRWLRQLIVWAAKRQGWVVIQKLSYDRHDWFYPRLVGFCDTSGYLRSGHQPGGQRQAERKIRKMLSEHGNIWPVDPKSELKAVKA